MSCRLGMFSSNPLLRPARPAISTSFSPHLSVRAIRQQPRYGFGGRPRQQPQYQRFSRTHSLRYLWQTSQGFRYGVGATGTATVGFVGYNLETVPVSGRLRFNWVSPVYEEQMGQQQFQQVIQEFGPRILPSWHPHTQMVRRVLDRLIPSSGLEGNEWEVYVIDDKSQINAFVIPGLGLIPPYIVYYLAWEQVPAA